MSTTLADALLESRASSTNFGILKLVALKFQADKMFNEGKKVRVHDVFALKGVEFVITFSDDVHFHNMVRYTYVNVKKDPLGMIIMVVLVMSLRIQSIFLVCIF